jgi:hypothetical protein
MLDTIDIIVTIIIDIVVPTEYQGPHHFLTQAGDRYVPPQIITA